MMNVSQQAIAAALTALANHSELIATPSSTRSYTRYLAAMGPSIRQMGIVPTLAIYEAGGEGKQKKDKLLPFLKALVESFGMNLGDGSLFDYAANLADAQKDRELRHLQRHLETALVAAKLALRTFPQNTPEKKKL